MKKSTVYLILFSIGCIVFTCLVIGYNEYQGDNPSTPETSSYTVVTPSYGDTISTVIQDTIKDSEPVVITVKEEEKKVSPDYTRFVGTWVSTEGYVSGGSYDETRYLYLYDNMTGIFFNESGIPIKVLWEYRDDRVILRSDDFTFPQTCNIKNMDGETKLELVGQVTRIYKKSN